MSHKIAATALFLVLAVLPKPGCSDEFDPDSIVSIMRRVADYAVNQWGGGSMAGLDNDWSEGTIMTGIMGLYRVTQDRAVLDGVDSWGNGHNWTWKGPGSADNYCALQTFCERYIVDPIPENENRYQPAKDIFDSRLNQKVDNWWGWQDALYMGPPALAMVGHITGDVKYFDSLTVTWWAHDEIFRDPTYNLWYWNTQESFKTTDAGYPQFWGAGNAWVIGGMVRCIKYLPADYQHRDEWIRRFVSYCDTLRVKQQPGGYWLTSLYEPTEFPNPESSCTSFFVYAMALGVHWGVLDSNIYIPVIRRAWSWLAGTVNEEGRVGYGQSWSNQPGNPVEWTSIPEGHGAFLLAGEGVFLISGLGEVNMPVLRASRGLSMMPLLYLEGFVPLISYGSGVFRPDGMRLPDRSVR